METLAKYKKSSVLLADRAETLTEALIKLFTNTKTELLMKERVRTLTADEKAKKEAILIKHINKATTLLKETEESEGIESVTIHIPAELHDSLEQVLKSRAKYYNISVRKTMSKVVKDKCVSLTVTIKLKEVG